MHVYFVLGLRTRIFSLGFHSRLFSLGLCTHLFVWVYAPYFICVYAPTYFIWVYTPVYFIWVYAPYFIWVYAPVYFIWVYAPVYFNWVCAPYLFGFMHLYILMGCVCCAPLIFSLRTTHPIIPPSGVCTICIWVLRTCSPLSGVVHPYDTPCGCTHILCLNLCTRILYVGTIHPY